MDNKKVKHLAIVGAMIGVMTVGGIMAYFSDGDTATNTFTVGQISIDLQEPNWDPDDAKELIPEEVIQKDPQIKNDGVNEEYVFMEVVVPYANVATANADGTLNAAADTELFSYEVNSGWVEVGSAKTNTDEGTVTHLYAYGTADAMTALAKDTTTPALFDNVRFANVVEDYNLEGTDLDIVVNAYGIQTTNINGDGAESKVSPVDVWSVLKNQNPTTSVAETEDAKTDVKETSN